MAQGGAGGGDDVVDKEEERVLRPQVDPLPDQEVELAHCQVRGHQVLLLVQVPDSGLQHLLHDDWDAVRVLLADLLALAAALLKWVLLLVQELHGRTGTGTGTGPGPEGACTVHGNPGRTSRSKKIRSALLPRVSLAN